MLQFQTELWAHVNQVKQDDHDCLFEPCILQTDENEVINFSVTAVTLSNMSFYLSVVPYLFIYLFAWLFWFFSSPQLSFLEPHCTEWSLTVMEMPMFPWKPLSTTEYTRVIFEPFVHLINYVFVLKAAWLDFLIMYQRSYCSNKLSYCFGSIHLGTSPRADRHVNKTTVP